MMEKKMRTPRFIKGIGSFLELVDSAIAVSSAVRDRRPTREADLVRLGIDPKAFGDIRYR
jgi:hypothetical protein